MLVDSRGWVSWERRAMANRYEADECGVSGGEEGVLDRERVGPSEPRVGG